MFTTARFFGSITGTVLTEYKPVPPQTFKTIGAIALGNTITGKNVPDNTVVMAFGADDANGNKTYQLNIAKPSSVPQQAMLAITRDVPVSELTLFATRMIVPLLAVPSQALTVELGNQNCNLNIYQRTTGLYVDLGINGQVIISGVIALDRNRIVRDAYLGFIGDLAFWDSQGTDDPDWTLLNKRYFLGYFSTT
jgi:hypothetical protein